MVQRCSRWTLFTQGASLLGITWDQEEDVRGGITWLELVILYSGNTEGDETATMQQPEKFQRQLAHFKRAVRKLSRHTVPENYIRHLETCYVARNRLADAAISNRQAAIKGMPVVSRVDAETIMQVLLTLRGQDKKRHTEAWKQGKLNLKPGDISIQGTAQRWKRAITKARLQRRGVEQHGAGDEEVAARYSSPGHSPPCSLDALQDDEMGSLDSNLPLPIQDGQTLARAAVHANLKLAHIICPTCDYEIEVAAKRLITKAGFSMVKCANKRCDDVSSSLVWLCRCRLPWVNCLRHLHSAEARTKRRPTAPKTLKAERRALYGSNRPLPAVAKERSLGERRGLYSHAKRRWKQLDETSSSDEYEAAGTLMRGATYPYTVTYTCPDTKYQQNEYDKPFYDGIRQGASEPAAGCSPPGCSNEAPPTGNVRNDGTDFTFDCAQSEPFKQPCEDGGASEANKCLTEYRRRRNRELKRAALEPNNSFARFKQSFEHSNVPESLKERFRNL